MATKHVFVNGKRGTGLTGRSFHSKKYGTSSLSNVNGKVVYGRGTEAQVDSQNLKNEIKQTQGMNKTQKASSQVAKAPAKRSAAEDKALKQMYKEKAQREVKRKNQQAAGKERRISNNRQKSSVKVATKSGW